MQHTWKSQILFFEKPGVGPGDADGDGYLPPPYRPPAGRAIRVRDDEYGIDLDDLTLDEGGHWTYSADKDAATMAIVLSADNGATWSDPIWSKQSMQNMADSGTNSASAVVIAQAAQDTADQALQLQGESGAKSVAGITPDANGNVPLTPADIGAIGTGSPVPASQVTGLAQVATTGSYGDLSNRPAVAIPLSQKAQPNGVADLGPDGKVPTDRLPSTIGQGTVQKVAGVSPDGNGNVPLTAASIGAATSAQGAKADSAVQPATLDDYATVDDLGDYAALADATPVLYDDGWPAVRRASSYPQVYDDTAQALATGADTTGPPSNIIAEGDYWDTVIYE